MQIFFECIECIGGQVLVFEDGFEAVGVSIDRSEAAFREKLRVDGVQEVTGVVAAQAGAGVIGVAAAGDRVEVGAGEYEDGGGAVFREEFESVDQAVPCEGDRSGGGQEAGEEVHVDRGGFAAAAAGDALAFEEEAGFAFEGEDGAGDGEIDGVARAGDTFDEAEEGGIDHGD